MGGMAAQRKTEIKRFMRAQPRPGRALMFLLHDVEDPVNVGSAFRIADALKAEAIILSGITPRPPHKLITRVGRSKDRRVTWRGADDVGTALDEIEASGYRRIAVEITEAAEPYHRCAYPERVCLVVGHEDHGVPDKVLSRCDGAVFIPMYGKGASLNVHVALGVVAFHALHAPTS
jgi:tRNA (guanosine-2'-O-)-methyltransferase